MAPPSTLVFSHGCSAAPIYSSSSKARRGLRPPFEKFFTAGKPHRDLSSSFSLSCSSPLSFPLLEFKYDSKPIVLGIHGKLNPRRRFSLRLRSRLRLLSSRLKRTSFRGLVEDAGAALRRNSRIITLSASMSAVLGFCFLFLKFTAVPGSKVVPYSEMVAELQSGRVSAVLFEEGSRRIFYDRRFDGQENVVSEMDGESLPMEGRNAKERSGSLLKWRYSTRKIDHDENFLLGLMREKGVTYSSAPQSVIMALRSLLITVISLWIPLTPLIWLLYRQLSAANSPAKKRRPSKQIVSFDDVQGVDSAKEELMEIVSCLQGSINYKKNL